MDNLHSSDSRSPGEPPGTLADQAINTFMTYLPAFISALLIFIIGFIISDWVGESIKKSFTIESSQAIYISMIGDAVKVILYFVTITIALSQLGVDVTIIYIVAQAFAWSLAIFVGVAAGIVVGWLLKDRVKEWLQRR
ncbi:MAG: hypothetical protein NXY59_01910 [Aigarchaeota archaeon]|nr:hypothetical protein [Candidatus Pelearchaeum maunauluense]